MPRTRHGDSFMLMSARPHGILSNTLRGEFIFLFRDDFNTAESAPLASPRTAEPGPGTWIITDTANDLDIVAGELVGPVVGVATGDPEFIADSSIARFAGLAAYFRTKRGAAGSTSPYLGFSKDNSIGINDTLGMGLAISNNVVGLNLLNADIVSGVGTYVNDTYANYFVVIRNLGFFLVQNGALLWVGNIGVDANMWLAATTVSTRPFGTHETIRAANLPANGHPAWDHGDLDQTDAITTPAVGNTFTHTANGVLKFDLTTMATGGSIIVFFRIQDLDGGDEDHWRLKLRASDNGLRLEEVNEGVPTTRAQVGGVLADGQVITLVFDGTNITSFIDDTQQWTYAAATAYQTEIDGEVDTLGTGGVLANLTTRTLDQRLATDILEAPRSAGDTFTHEADFVGEFTVDALPSAGQIEFWFRIADSTPASEDLWRVTIDSTGAIDLDELVAGTPTQRGTSAAAITAGERIVITADDETISIFGDVTREINYASAATSKTAVAGELDTLGTAGAVSDIIIYPRTLSGSAKQALDRMAAA